MAVTRKEMKRQVSALQSSIKEMLTYYKSIGSSGMKTSADRGTEGAMMVFNEQLNKFANELAFVQMGSHWDK